MIFRMVIWCIQLGESGLGDLPMKRWHRFQGVGRKWHFLPSDIYIKQFKTYDLAVRACLCAFNLIRICSEKP